MRSANAPSDARRPTGARRHEAILDFAVSQSPVIYYVVDLADASRIVFISSNVERLTGHKAAAFMDNPRFAFDCVHPEDMAVFKGAGERLRATGAATREYRFATRDRGYRWFRDELKFAPEQPDEMVGCMIDITEQKAAETRLSDSETLKAAISDAALNAIVVVDEGGAILEFNPVAERTFGYSRDAVIGKPMHDLFVPKRHQQAHADAMQRFVEGGDYAMPTGVVETQGMRSDGSVFPAEANVTEVMLAGRRVFVAELWDTTERVRARRERERLSGLLQDAVQSSGTGIAIYDKHDRLILCNAAYASVFHDDPVTMIGSHAADNHRRIMARSRRWEGGTVDTSEAALTASFARLHAAEGEPFQMQLDDGRWQQVTTRATAEGGRVFVRSDITRLKQREAELREAQGILEDAVESLAEGFALYDAQDRLVMCNQHYRDLNTLTADLLVPGVRWLDLIRAGAERGQYPDAAGRTDAWLAERSLQRKALETNVELRQDGGRWHRFSNARTRNGGTVVTRADITEHKALEQALRDNEEMIRRIVEACPAPVVMTRAADGVAYYESPAFQALFNGDGIKNGIRSTLDVYADPAQRDELLARLRREGALDDVEVEFKKADGRRFWVSMSARLIDYKGEEVVVSSLYDLTERRAVAVEMARQREALRESEQRFRRLLEAYPVPVGMHRAATGEAIYESPAAQALFQRELTPGKVTRTRDNFVDPADREGYVAALRRHGAVKDHELHLKKADGTTFWVSVSARLIDFEGEEVVVSSVHDLTERRAVEAELARQREALHQSEKLAALGSLLAGVAHELNNPLSVVVGQALMLQETAKDPKTAERATKIGNAADRCSRIVRTFLAMARQQQTKRAAVDLNEIVEATLDVTGYSLRTAGVDLTRDLAPDLPPVWADADQLNQVVTNLVVNAQQAMAEVSGGGSLKIATAWDEAQGAVLLSVKDSGPGMSAEIQSRIFEPFFTTKKVGTGIGLAVSHKIIEAMDGDIAVNSTPGEGATFLISLPMAALVGSRAAAAHERQHQVRPCKVLVIDDEPEVTRMLEDILRAAGHDVTTADSGQRALRLLSRHDYEVILSDLRMPNMDGPQLYETLKSLSPRLLGRVAFITGDTFSPAVSAFLKETGRPVVQKPFSPDEIQDLIGRVLASERIETLKI